MQSVRTESDQFTVSILSLQADGADTVVTLEIEPSDPTFRGVLYGLIRLAADGAEAPVHVIGRVID